MPCARTLLLTGATGTLGPPLARALASDGWRLALHHRDERSAERAAALAAELGDETLVLRGDLANADAALRVVDQLESTGGLSALLHAAGSYHRKPLLDEGEDDWRQAFDDNLHSAFHLCRAAGSAMAARGFGRIITFGLAGASALGAQPMITAHSIAKAGLLALSRSLAVLFADRKVTVNTLALGFMDAGSAEQTGVPASRVPAGRLGEASDVLAAVRFLLSDEASYVSGSEITISGGFGLSG
jgi:3-oxoacyl-[acyl-carrier protein] reductase